MIEDAAITSEVSNGRVELSGANHWSIRAAAGYDQLGWVKNGGLQQRMVEVAALTGTETVVDAGTGSGAILDALSPHLQLGGRILGFDISLGMLQARKSPLPANANLFVADAYNVPLSDNSVDLVTARQVYHNLPGISGAVQEAQRILRPGGRLVICEYVPHDEHVLTFERPIWEKKEAGRNLWTGEQLVSEVAEAWGEGGVRLEYGVLPQYSNVDWMRKSGLPTSTQSSILADYLQAPDHIRQRMNITEDGTGDTLIDRPFAFVVATKQYDK